jgi:TRAP-type C4-dicarboxylate transport system substrate-binding protein
MKHLTSASLCLAATLSVPAAQAQPPRTLEFAVQNSPSDPAARALSDFARVAEGQTRGAVRIRLRFQVMDVAPGALRLGAQGGALVLRDDLEALCPAVAAFRVPSLFPNLAVMDRTFGTMRPEFEASCPREVTVLGWTLPGPRHLFVQGPVEPTAEGQLTGVGLTETSVVQRRILAAQPEVVPGAADVGGIRLVPGVVVAPGERGLFASFNHVVMTPAGMDLGALVVNTVAFNALSPEQQRVVRAAAESTVQSLSRTLRSASLGNVTRIPESPAWTQWVSASRDRAAAEPAVAPMFNRMRMMLGPVNPPQTSPVEVVPAPPPGRVPPPASEPAPTAPTTPTAPASEPAPTAPTTPTPAPSEPAPTSPTTPTAPTAPTSPTAPRGGPAVDLPFVDVPPALMEIGYPRAMSAMRSRLMRCYAPALRAPTPISGQITLTLSVLPNGSLASVRTLNAPELTTITDLVLTRCVEMVMRSLRVPGLQADPVTVRQAVVFRAR